MLESINGRQQKSTREKERERERMREWWRKYSKRIVLIIKRVLRGREKGED